jgi:hypothetical protein
MARADIKPGTPYPFLTGAQLMYMRDIEEESGLRWGWNFFVEYKKKEKYLPIEGGAKSDFGIPLMNRDR